jgi:hypothetical protein
MNDGNILKRYIKPAARSLGLKVNWRRCVPRARLGWCRREPTRNRCRTAAPLAHLNHDGHLRAVRSRGTEAGGQTVSRLCRAVCSKCPQNVPISPEKHPMKRSQNPGKMLKRLVELVGIEPTTSSLRTRRPPNYLSSLLTLSSRVRSITVQFRTGSPGVASNFAAHRTPYNPALTVRSISARSRFNLIGLNILVDRGDRQHTHAGRFLLRPKCLHGIDGCGATSGNNGRDQAGDREQSTDGEGCNWIVQADTKEKCLNRARGEPRGD